MSGRLRRNRTRLAIGFAVLVVSAMPHPAYAIDDSVVITSPQDGGLVVLLGSDSNGFVAEEPLIVSFTASGSPVSCSLDGGPAVACTSPTSYDNVAAGAHTVTVMAGTATATSSFTVSTILLGTPPEAPKTTARVHARWRVHGRRTSVRRLELSHLQERVRVNLVCRGRGCPSLRPYSRTVSGRAVLTRAMRNSVLRPRTRVIIKVVKSDFHTKKYIFTTRRSEAPSLTVRWL